MKILNAILRENYLGVFNAIGEKGGEVGDQRHFDSILSKDVWQKQLTNYVQVQEENN